MSEHNHVVNKEGELALNKVDDVLKRMDGERKEDILENFNAFKRYLGERIELAQGIGLSEETLAKTAEKIGDYLAANEEPRNREEKLLKELWNAGEQEHRHALAHILVRLAKTTQ
ncbi:DUF3243 domain-containing protein [Paenibacillus fonticola]|uniref:DUF3243 domain-containing protein n=1 Tax=Paenibacillus fonticola TaxID=379896 RepID=UPI00035D3187|nr:DUF3243 domain-containing protein [Paenibacillus fonticola]